MSIGTARKIAAPAPPGTSVDSVIERVIANR
jgi:hypothetical protein